MNDLSACKTHRFHRFFLLIIALVFSVSGFAFVCGIEPAFAAGKVQLNKTKATMESGAALKLKVRNAKRTVKWSTGDRSIVSFGKKSGKYKQAVILKAGKKTGTTWIRAKVGKRTLKCKVTVRAAKPSDPTEPVAPEISEETSDLFDLAFADFSFRLLQKTLEADAASSGKGIANTGDAAATNAGSNVLISPDSVLTALTMTENGAAGQTLAEMHQVLYGNGNAVPEKAGADANKSEAASEPAAVTLAGANAYLSELHARLTGTKEPIYTLANSIWTRQEKIIVNEKFRETNETYHKAAFFEGAFDDATVAKMNEWVENNTMKMIKQIIDPEEGLSEDARMVLINAIAFDAEWADVFRENQVKKNQTFTRADGTKQTTVTMLEGTEHTYLEAAGGTGFAKNYKGCDIAFVGLLPPKGMDARTYAGKLTGKAFLSAWKKAQSKPQTVRIKLPCFSYDYSASMNDVLIDMGMGRAFSNGADFSAMMDPSSPEYDDGLHIDKVLHKTHIELNKDGTKAAAATAVIMDKNGAVFTPDPKEVFLDRPFVYALVDTQTGNPLFLGTVESIAY